MKYKLVDPLFLVLFFCIGIFIGYHFRIVSPTAPFYQRENSKSNKDTVTILGYDPKLVIRQTIEIDTKKNESFVTDYDNLLRVSSPSGIAYICYDHYSKSDSLVNKIISTKIPSNYCIEMKCLDDELNPYPVILSFKIRKAGHRN